MEKQKQSFWNYLFTDPDKRFWVWIVLAFSLAIGIGAIKEGAAYFGAIVIIVMNGAFLFGSWMNFTGRWK